jgi:hypothetical protein
MYSVFIVILFLLVKIIQWLNSFVLARIFGIEKSFSMMISILIFISAIFIFGLLVKKFFPKAMSVAWVVVVLALIVSSSINPSWAIIFLAGLFLYALIGMEAQVLQSFSNYKKIPRFVLFLLTLLPVVISYLPLQSHTVTPQIFYIITSAFAFFASYSARIYGGGKSIIYQKAPPIWFGLFFLLGSALLYYFGIYNATEAPPAILLPFILLFYAGGALIIYMSIDGRLREISNI